MNTSGSHKPVCSTISRTKSSGPCTWRAQLPANSDHKKRKCTPMNTPEWNMKKSKSAARAAMRPAKLCSAAPVPRGMVAIPT